MDLDGAGAEAETRRRCSCSGAVGEPGEHVPLARRQRSDSDFRLLLALPVPISLAKPREALFERGEGHGLVERLLDEVDALRTVANAAVQKEPSGGGRRRDASRFRPRLEHGAIVMDRQLRAEDELAVEAASFEPPVRVGDLLE